MSLIHKHILKRLCLMLCLIILTSGFMPAYALDSKNKAKVVKLSGDWLSGYYVVYNYNGKDYRSDEMGTKFNQHAWKHFDEKDRRRIMYNFAFAPHRRKDQFGEDGSQEMTDWVNDVTGWTAAGQILKERIAAREFPGLTAFYTAENPLALSVDIYDLHEYSGMPEVVTLFTMQNEMLQLYELGKGCYEKLAETKANQTSIAVKALSGDLISLITERVLVPAISPASIAGLSAQVAGEIIGLADKALGLSDSLYEYAIGERVTAESASRIIEQLWYIIDTNEELARRCMNHALRIRGELEDGYAAAASAVQARQHEAQQAMQTKEDKLAEFHRTVVPTPNNISNISEAEVRQNAAIEYVNTVILPAFAEWEGALPEKIDAVKEVKGTPAPFSTFLFDMPMNWSYLSRNIDWQSILDDADASVAEATSSLNGTLARNEEYNTEAYALFDRENAAWQDIYAKYLGVEPYLPASSRINIPDIAAVSINTIGAMLDGTNANAGLQDSLNRLTEHYSLFQSGRDDFESMMRENYMRYSELQSNYISSLQAYLGYRASRDQIVADLPDYVKAQQMYMEKLPLLTEMTNPILYPIRNSLDFDTMAEELEPMIEGYRDNQRRMDAARAQKDYFAGELDSFFPQLYSMDYFDAMCKYAGPGTLRTRASIDAEYDNTPYYPPQNMTIYMLAANALYKDFAEKGPYFQNVEFILDELDAELPAIRRMNGLDKLNAVESRKTRCYDEYKLAFQSSYNHNRLYSYYYDKISAIEKSLNLTYPLDPNYSYIPVTGIGKGAAPFSLMMSASDVSLPVGSETTLSAAVVPSDATFKEIIWESLDLDIAEVDGGVVTGLKNGTARIIARAEDSVRTESEGVITYDPAPLEFIVSVGDGQDREAQWDSYFYRSGEDLQGSPIYHSSTAASGTLTAEAVLKPELGEDRTLVMALYNTSGQMLALSVISTADGGTLLRTGYALQGEQEIRVKIFALSATGSINPAFHKPITGTVNIGEDAYGL